MSSLSLSSLPQVGVHPTATDRSMPVIELAREAEARGFTGISLPEHTHAPVAAESLVPGYPVMEQYQRTFDPYIACAFVAATTSLEVGTSISLLAEHDPIALAKAIATLDYLSSGRVVLGVGFGYNRQEVADHGVAPADRFAVVEETVALMRALWTDEIAEFSGQHHQLSPSRAWPKPTRPGGPPVLLGGKATERNFGRITAWADGWNPAGLGVTSARFGESVAELRRRWQDAGRAGDPQILCLFAPGPRDEMRRQLEAAAALGITRMHLRVEERSRDEVLPLLDELAAGMERNAAG